jgi:hypothetical protein
VEKLNIKIFQPILGHHDVAILSLGTLALTLEVWGGNFSSFFLVYEGMKQTAAVVKEILWNKTKKWRGEWERAGQREMKKKKKNPEVDFWIFWYFPYIPPSQFFSLLLFCVQCVKRRL